MPVIKALALDLSDSRPLWAMFAVSPFTDYKTQKNHTTLEEARLEKRQPNTHVARQTLFAVAHDDRRQEQVDLVDQGCSEGVSGEVGAGDGEVLVDSRFQPPNRLGVEVSRMLVLRMEAASSDSEYTILSAAYQISAKSHITGDMAATLGSVSQSIVVSYMRRS